MRENPFRASPFSLFRGSGTADAAGGERREERREEERGEAFGVKVVFMHSSKTRK